MPSIISVDHLISLFQDAIGKEKFERIEINDYDLFDEYAMSLGYQYDEKTMFM